MSQLPSTADTIKELAKTGIGTDSIGHKLFLFHQLNARIVAYAGRHYYIEGDVTTFINGYDYFWVSSRYMGDDNVVAKVGSATYDSDKMWTDVEFSSTNILAASYEANDRDVESFICGRYDITDLLKDVGNVVTRLVEDNSLGNSVVSKMNFTMNDENRTFYDKVNRRGYFYPKQVITEVDSVSSISEHSLASGLYSCFVKVKDLSRYYNGTDFINGCVEFLNGTAIGNRALISSASGLSLKVFEHCSRDLKDTSRLGIGVKKGDSLRVFKLDTFWCRFDVWHRSHIDEKVYLFSGKLDLKQDNIQVDDLSRTITIEAKCVVNDMMLKTMAELNFDGSLNMPRMREFKTMFLDKCSNKSLKMITRQEVDPNPLDTIKILQVGYDVSEGWHTFDYSPEGNLFRFDLGTWFQAIDEGSLEKSTKSIFIASQEASRYSNPAVLPDHSIESNTQEENIKIERTWHGQWCSFSIDLEDSTFVGSVNGQRLKDATSPWKKFAGLPNRPHRLLFHVTDEHKVDKQMMFSYSYDNGEVQIPSIFFDYIQYRKSDGSYQDVTYDMGFQSMSYHDTSELPWNNNTYKQLIFSSFNKFNGIMMKFKNTDMMYNSFVARMMSQMRLNFSNGDSDYTPNINNKYVGGYCTNVPGVKDELELAIMDKLSSDDPYYDEIVNKEMWLLCLSSTNFLECRKIKSIDVIGAGRTTIRIVLENGYTNNIEQWHTFIVINKNEDIRFIDVHSSFRDGDFPDVVSVNSTDLATGTFDDIRLANINNVPASINMIPNDYLYIGHRKKFDSVALLFNLDRGHDNDYADIAWYIRNNVFEVEYWNGGSWVKASDVSILPTSIVNLKDTSTTIETDDDLIKYRVLFGTSGWATGGYDDTAYATGGAPSDIDETKIYMIRIRLSLNVPIRINYVSIASPTELCLAVVWNDIQNWFPAVQDIESGKYVVDTLTNENLNLGLYQLIVEKPGSSYSDIIEARPITQFKGYLGDLLYGMIDIQNIDERFDTDMVVYNKNSLSNVSHIPTNMNHLGLMNKMLTDSNMSKKAVSCVDHLNDFSKQNVNTLGLRTDGVYPIDVGWYGAFKSVRGTDYEGIVGSYQHVCVIRDNGIYRAFCVTSALSGVDLWESKDLVNWDNKGNILTNFVGYLMAIDVVKNKDDATYAYYLSVYDGATRYKVQVVTSSSLAIDFATATNIISVAGQNIGRCSVLHIKGIATAALACRRIMWVEVYDDVNVGADQLPTDDCTLYYYENTVAITGAWSHGAGEIASAKNPAFVRGSYVANDGTDVDNYELNHFDLLFTKVGFGGSTVLYKSYAPFNLDTLVAVWSTPAAVVIGDFMSDFSTIKDSVVYKYIGSSSRTAFTMVPGREDVIVMFGIVSSGVTVKFVTNGLTDWDSNCLQNVADDLNGLDWNMTDKSSIDLDISLYGNKCLYLGFPKKFNKISALDNKVKYSDRVKVQYWNGTAWSPIDTIYQLKKKISDSNICPLFGAYWDDISDWQSEELSGIADQYFTLMTEKESMYWIKIELDNTIYYTGNTLNVKGFKCCYTSLFITEGRNLMLLDNWSYTRLVHSFSNEMNRKLRIDSLSYDSTNKVILVNVCEDNTYEYRLIDIYVFDIFGKYKGQQNIWDSGTEHIYLQDRPGHTYRAGVSGSIELDGDTLITKLIGKWLTSYIETVFDNGSFISTPEIGFNVPIPKIQKVRKYSLRNTDWGLSGNFWNDTFLNNIWLAKMLGADQVHSANFGDYVFFSLTNNGLLNEELINGPDVKLQPGFYSAMEKSFLTLAYHVLVDDEITEYPAVPVDGHSYLLVAGAETDWENVDLYNKKNYIATYTAAGTIWSFAVPVYGTIVFIDDTNTFEWFDGTEWRPFTTNGVWPGRAVDTLTDGIGLEYSMGQDEIKLPYFRPYSNKPTRFANNNVVQYLDDKVVTVMRNVPLNLNTSKVFGNPDTTFPYNLKAMCAALMEDLSSVKDEVGDVEERDILEINSPAMVFGAYDFKDIDSSGFVLRQQEFRVDPLGIGSVNLFKMNGKVRNWKKALLRSALGVYTDITEDMNYKNADNNIAYGNTQNIYLCCESRFFSLMVGYIKTVPSITFDLEYYAADGSWYDLTHEVVEGTRYDNVIGTLDQEVWYKKNVGYTLTWDPFQSQWARGVWEGTTGYWMRFKVTAAPGNMNLYWIILNGMCLWDNMRWWEDYAIYSDKKPTVDPVYTEDLELKKYFDSYVPLSISYDSIRKRVTGCMWDFLRNSYYPFSIQFDRKRIRTDDANYWSFEDNGIRFIDSEDYMYMYNLQSMKSNSPVDTKVLMINTLKQDTTALIGNIKNFDNGDELFQFDIGQDSGS